jgi:hypothetical protein
MNESIRDYLTRRVRWAMGVGLCAWLAMAASAASGVRNPLVVFAGMLTFGGAIISTLWIKCPRCSVRLGQSIAGTLAIPMLRPQPNFCPYCGVSLDEPRFKQLSLGQQGPYNPIR